MYPVKQMLFSKAIIGQLLEPNLLQCNSTHQVIRFGPQTTTQLTLKSSFGKTWITFLYLFSVDSLCRFSFFYSVCTLLWHCYKLIALLPHFSDTSSYFFVSVNSLPIIHIIFKSLTINLHHWPAWVLTFKKSAYLQRNSRWRRKKQ